jgi:hypothetical protein
MPLQLPKGRRRRWKRRVGRHRLERGNPDRARDRGRILLTFDDLLEVAGHGRVGQVAPGDYVPWRRGRSALPGRRGQVGAPLIACAPNVIAEYALITSNNSNGSR